MRIWREIRDGLRALLRRDLADRDVDDELRHFFQEAEDDLVARGATPEEARRTARLRYGDPLPAREDVRGSGWEGAVGTLLHDLRLSLRMLRRSPTFTAMAVLTLGIGVGATVAIASAVWPVLLEPLPYPESQRLVAVADRGPDGGPLQVTFGTYRELVQRNPAFESIAVFKPWQPTLSGGDQPVRVEGQSVSASYFDVLKVAPAMGAGFDPGQDRPGGAAQVVMAHELWRDRFASAGDLVGRVVYLDGAPATVVGVMPEGFQNVTMPDARVWTLLQYDPLPAGFDTREWGRHLDMVARLQPAVSLDQAKTALDGLAGQPSESLPRPAWAALDDGFSIRSLGDAVTADVRPTMLLLVGAVALLVAATCANLTIVMLARAARRKEEFALRASLGASRGRLGRYLVTEGLVLSALGGALGVVVARLGLASLVAMAPPSLPRTSTLEVDGPAVVLAVALTALVGILFGLAPGLHRAGARSKSLREGGRGSVRRSRTTRRVLVVAEVACATMLLIGSGLLLRSAQRLFHQSLGMDPSGVVVMQVHAAGLERGDRATHAFFDAALQAVRGVPGVGSVAMTSQLPLSGDFDVYGVVPAETDVVEGALGPAARYAVTPSYFETLGVSILRGRPLDERDVEGATRVAVVSRSLAGRLFPGRDPLGERVRVGAQELAPYTVVGVAEDVKHASLVDGSSQGVYVTSQQWHWADRVRWIVVKADGDATRLIPSIRSAIWSVGADQAVVRAQSMDAVVMTSEARRRFVLLLLSAFALSALVVCVVGLFGVLSGAVVERTREMGVRAALGASRQGIVSMVVRQGLVLTAVGVVIGLAGAAAASGALGSMLFQVSPFDPLTYVGVVAVLVVGALVASVVPAVRAGRADPLEALRAE